MTLGVDCLLLPIPILRNDQQRSRCALPNTRVLSIAVLGTFIAIGGYISVSTLAQAANTLSGTSSVSTISTALQAPLNSDPHAKIDDVVVSIVNGQALADNRPIFDAYETISEGSDQISIYVVRDGDTLSSIARMYGVTENTIRWANNLNPKSVIQKDQQLIILPISGIKYTVKKGDTLKSIAALFSADESEILSYNNLSTTATFKAGEEIIIPNGEISTTAKKSSSGKASSGTSVSPASKTPTSGYLIRPISGGKRTQGIHGHNAVDLAHSLNTPILASASGKVLIAKQGGWNGGYGSYVVISHPNGMQTLYAHLNSVSVAVGQNVSQGAVIGKMGSTGRSTGSHLHFEVRGGTNPF